jgi:hypothetical protein
VGAPETSSGPGDDRDATGQIKRFLGCHDTVIASGP